MVTVEGGWQGYYNEEGEFVYAYDPYGNVVGPDGSSLAGPS
jgi:hypothetical protein